MFDMELHCEIDNFIFDKFAIAPEKPNGDSNWFVIVDYNPMVDGTMLEFVKWENGDWVHGAYYEIRLNESKKCGYDVLCSKDESPYLDIGYDLVGYVLRVMAYIMTAPRSRVARNRAERNLETEGKKQRKNKKHNKIFLLDEIVEYVSANDLASSGQGTNQIQCPCWSVRGHYRHYKSGKTVFIKSYEKGKERGKIAPKDKVYMV